MTDKEAARIIDGILEAAIAATDSQRKKLEMTDKSLHRPKDCPKYCIYNGIFNGTYNGAYGCEYKAHTPLKEPIKKWQSCPYFEMIKEGKPEKERYYDPLYGRFAVYKDAHSAVWED